MIQDIAPSIYYNQYAKKEPDAASVLMFVRGNDILYRTEDEHIVYPAAAECDTEGVTLRYLFSIDSTRYFLAVEEQWHAEEEKEDTPYFRLLAELEREWFSFQNHMLLRNRRDKLACFAGAAAWQIGSWYADNRICGRCGHPLRHDEKERMMRCDRCGNTVYPKICPAVIVAVTDHDKLLLTRYSAGYRHFALVAGFAEAGETIEETVHREVMEEVGLQVTNLRYYKSQPWTFTDTLLFGFFCDVDRDRHITMDTSELSYANWIDRKDLAEVEDDGISLTREMIRVFREGRERSYT